MIHCKLLPQVFEDLWMMKVEGKTDDFLNPIDSAKFITNNIVGNITVEQLYEERIHELMGLDIMYS